MFDTSYSSISAYKSCKKKYYFKNRLLLEPKRDGPEQSIGKNVHDAFEKYFKGATKNDCALEISKAFDAATPNNDWEAEDLIVGKKTAIGMWLNYPFADVQFDRVYPEQKFKIEVPGFKDVFYGGYLDGLIVDKGKYWIREVKTTGLAMQQMKNRADCSAQATGYIWAMQRILNERVHGVYFDIIRKPLLRKSQGETTPDFADRIFAAYSEPANQDKLYARHFSYRSELQLQQFEDDLKQDVEDILRSVEKDKFQRNTDACFNYGRECPYMKICFQDQSQLDEDMLDALYNRRVHRDANCKTLTVEDSDLDA